MNLNRMGVAIFGAAAILLSPVAMIGQMDSSGNPASPANTNLPAANQPGMGNPNGSTSTTPTSMRDSLGNPGETGQAMADKMFLRSATEGGTAEVKLGMLAVQKGGPEVKEFGQHMVDDHTSMNKDMAGIADTLGVMLPKKMNKDDQAEYDKLSGLSGEAFDKEYILYMVKDHRADFRAFRMEATAAADPALQTEAAKSSMVIRDHLMMLTKLATAKGVTLPPRPPRPDAPAAAATK